MSITINADAAIRPSVLMAKTPTPGREGATCAHRTPQAPCYRAPVSREPRKPLPEPIPDTPENVAAALMGSPPRKPDEWRYDTDRCEDQD